MGYIFYELTNYEQALKYLEAISPTFYDYPDVLLAIGWSAYKAQNYRKALVALNKLINDYPNNLNKDEAYFVIGECYLKLGYFQYAIKAFDEIINKHPVANHFAQRVKIIRAELNKEEQQIEQLKTDLLLLETKLMETVHIEQTDNVPEEIKKEKERIQKQRESLLKNLIKERQLFLGVTKAIKDLKDYLEKKEMQKDWRAYAEYGKTRAIFLKGLSEQ